jgi:hypothetical protein
VEPLNTMELEVIARALSAPEMARWAQQVLMISQKLGIPPPQWAVEPKPPAGNSSGGS